MSGLARWLGLLLVSLLLASCGAGGGGAEEVTPLNTPQETAPTVRQVRVLTADLDTLTTTRSTSVTVEPAQESRVAAKTPGQVAGILKREGVRVEAGEPVIVLDAAHLNLQLDNARVAVESARVALQKAQNATLESQDQANAQLRAAETNLRLAQTQLEEGEALYGAGGLSRADLDALGAALEGANAAYGQAQNAVSQSGRAEGEDLALLRLHIQQAETGRAGAEQALSDATIRAPFAGEVAQMLVEEGEFVGAGSPTFRLASTEAPLARFSVPPEDAAYLLGQGSVTLSYGGEAYEAVIIRSSTSEGSRLVELTAQLGPSARIPTGTVTRLDYTLELATGVALPSGAVRTSAEGSSVFVVEDGKAVRRAVQVLGEAGDRVVVSGPERGAQVVYPVPPDLRPDTEVSVVTEPGL